MKKYLGLFVTLLVAIMVLPEVVSATPKISFVKKECTSKTNDLCSSTITMYVEGTAAEIAALGYDSDQGVNTLSVAITFASSDTTIVSFAKGALFGGGTTTQPTFSLVSTSQLSGTKIELGTLTISYPSNVDCTVNVTVNGTTDSVTTGTGTVTTGSSLPYIVLASGVVIAFGIYYVTKKQTKLYKI